jgi:hypothetical protein
MVGVFVLRVIALLFLLVIMLDVDDWFPDFIGQVVACNSGIFTWLK